MDSIHWPFLKVSPVSYLANFPKLKKRRDNIAQNVLPIVLLLKKIFYPTRKPSYFPF